jgi:hypothetical protein
MGHMQDEQVATRKRAAKKRPSVPKAVEEKVLKEYRHLCAICGRDRPHLHHIDENPQNNDPLNLLPLCPNCHLQDTHDPTSPPDPRKLGLFRRHKDPLILDPRFHPIFCRMRCLYDVEMQRTRPKYFNHLVNELIDFIGELEMGSFYRKKVSSALTWVFQNYATKLTLDGAPKAKDEVKRDPALNEQAWEHGLNQAEFLIIEMLRYQNWDSPVRRGLRGAADQ